MGGVDKLTGCGGGDNGQGGRRAAGLGRGVGGTGTRCSCFHLKLDSDHNVSSSLCSPRSLVPLEGFPLSPLEEATALGFVSHFDLGGSGDRSV